MATQQITSTTTVILMLVKRPAQPMSNHKIRFVYFRKNFIILNLIEVG